uniref:CWF19-like protein 1 n=1 Tax=Ditylenchus dipsaci TaxID=166011 RepID=A0A915D2X6_9BILA
MLINRVLAVNKKCGDFDILFCVGEFFGPDDAENRKVLSGEIDFPIPTYILGPCCPSTSVYYTENSVEISPSLTFLGRKGILNTASGLTIGYLSGIETSASTLNAFQFNDETIDDLLLPVRANSGFLGVDILLTSMWPAEVWKHSSNQPSEEVEGSKSLARLAAGLKPRYHVAGLGQTHYERTPYRNHRVLLEAAQMVTRFIGLAQVGNPKKDKWLYAFSITPMRKMHRAELTAQPENTSEFPYMEILQEALARKSAEETDAARSRGESQFFYDIEADLAEEDNVDRGGRRKRPNDSVDKWGSKAKKNFQQINPDTCWFCLSNAAAEKHLIVSIGTTCYTAMPKGPLTEDHVLIMSIDHVQSLVAATDEIRAEVDKFKDAFALMCDKKDKVLCVFERNYKSSHLTLQLIPVPKSAGKALRSSFLNAARLKNIEFTFLKENEQLPELINEGCPYFYVELPDGTRMISRSMSGFPIQFGREVLCGKALLDAEEKIDWKNCELSKEKEAGMTMALKEQFKPFDFTNSGDSSDED